MTITRHQYEVYIRATPEQVWQAIVDPEFTRRYYYGTAFTSSLEPGTRYSYLQDDGVEALEGEIEEVDPPRRLVMTFKMLFAPNLAEEPASRVEWILTPVGSSATRLTLRHGDLAHSPGTWATAKLGWVYLLGGLKTLLETGAPLGPVDDPAASPTAQVVEEVDGDWHRAQGVEANNATWQWLGKPDDERSDEDDELMTRSAYAAAYHWARATGRGPENEARAEWLLSRVWAVRGEGALALRHADRSAAAVAAGGLQDFDLAYAHEARARALACLGRHDEARRGLAAARAVPIADDEDRTILEGDLDGGPWFGISVAASA